MDFIVLLTHRSLVLSKDWERHIKDAVRFYDVAQKRDGTIDQHIRDFRESKEEAAVLVFGGFHTSAIKDMLRQQGFSYVVISPRITAIDKRHQDYYKHLMSEGYHAFEAPFLVARANKPPSMLYTATVVGDLPIARELRALASSVEALGSHFDPLLVERDLSFSPQIHEAPEVSNTVARSPRVRSEMRTATEEGIRQKLTELLGAGMVGETLMFSQQKTRANSVLIEAGHPVARIIAYSDWNLPEGGIFERIDHPGRIIRVTRTNATSMNGFMWLEAAALKKLGKDPAVTGVPRLIQAGAIKHSFSPDYGKQIWVEVAGLANASPLLGYPGLEHRLALGKYESAISRSPLKGDPYRIFDVLIKSGEILQAVHGRNLLHNDFNPSNILVDPQGGVMLSDFEIATVPGTVLRYGSFEYKAEETTKTEKSDVYSFVMTVLRVLDYSMQFFQDRGQREALTELFRKYQAYIFKERINEFTHEKERPFEENDFKVPDIISPSPFSVKLLKLQEYGTSFQKDPEERPDLKTVINELKNDQKQFSPMRSEMRADLKDVMGVQRYDDFNQRVAVALEKGIVLLEGRKGKLNIEPRSELLARLQKQNQLAEAPLAQAVDLLTAADFRNIADLLVKLYPQALSEVASGEKTSPIQHIAYVVEHMVQIMLRQKNDAESLSPSEIKIGVMAALFHDAALGRAGGEGKLRKADIKDKINQVISAQPAWIRIFINVEMGINKLIKKIGILLNLNRLTKVHIYWLSRRIKDGIDRVVIEGVVKRWKHMAEGAILAGEVLGGYFSLDEIKAIQDLIRAHDNASIQEYDDMLCEAYSEYAFDDSVGGNNYKSYREELFKATKNTYPVTMESFLVPAKEKLMKMLREADRLWMVTKAGVDVDLDRDIAKADGTVKEDLKKALDSKLYTDSGLRAMGKKRIADNIKRHFEEKQLYSEAADDYGFINDSLYRTQAGYDLFKALIKGTLGEYGLQLSDLQATMDAMELKGDVAKAFAVLLTDLRSEVRDAKLERGSSYANGFLKHFMMKMLVKYCPPDLFLFAGTSGAGKSTFSKLLLQKRPEQFMYLMRTTTRKPRPEDAKSQDHRFLNKAEFDREMARGNIYFPMKNYGEDYGFHIDDLASAVLSGKTVVLEGLRSSEEMRRFWPGVHFHKVAIVPVSAQDDIESAPGREKVAKLLRDRILKRDSKINPVEAQERSEVMIIEIPKILKDADMVIRNTSEESPEILFLKVNEFAARIQRSNGFFFGQLLYQFVRGFLRLSKAKNDQTAESSRSELRAIASSVEAGNSDPQLLERRRANFNQIQEAQLPSAGIGTVKIRSEARTAFSGASPPARKERREIEAVDVKFDNRADGMVRRILKHAQPATVFVDAEDFLSLSEVQKQEYLIVALSNKVLHVVVYNQHGESKDKLLAALLRLDRVTRTGKDLDGAQRSFGRPNEPSIQLSKNILPSQEVVQRFKKRISFFKTQGQNGGTLEAALLWAWSGGEDARLREISQGRDGFWIVAETLVNALQKSYDATLAFAVAA